MCNEILRMITIQLENYLFIELHKVNIELWDFCRCRNFFKNRLKSGKKKKNNTKHYIDKLLWNRLVIFVMGMKIPYWISLHSYKLPLTLSGILNYGLNDDSRDSAGTGSWAAFSFCVCHLQPARSIGVSSVVARWSVMQIKRIFPYYPEMLYQD